MTTKRVVVVSGLAGAGKSTAARALEDLGYFVVDNLPPQLLETLVALAGAEVTRLGFVIDAREASFLAGFAPAWERLKNAGHELHLVFLDCADDVLIRRFQETRRRHPLAGDGTVSAGIQRERALLEDMRQRADWVVDTRDVSVHELKRMIGERLGEARATPPSITLLSFGFKHGLPPELDTCFDARFLPNPYFVAELRALTGKDAAVRRYVDGLPDSAPFLDKIEDMITFLLPRFAAEGKQYVTFAIGCTGGKHRSVALVEDLHARLAQSGVAARIVHRDVDR
jgi:UPF0042 nucleotide-binding protein